MTLAPVAPTQTDALQVRTDPDGQPLAIRYEGRIWVVDPGTESRHWFGGDAWWDTRSPAVVGNGGPVRVEYWRVQVRLSSNSALQTFTLRRDPLSPGWLLEHIRKDG